MKRLKKIVRLSVTHLLIIAMLTTPMSPIFAIPNEKTDDADLVAGNATVEAEKNVPILIDEEKMIYEIKGDAKSREWIYSAPDDILNGTTSGLLEYFLDSLFLHQDIYSRSTIGGTYKSDYTCHAAFKELVSRKDLLQTLENYAKKAFTNLSISKEVLLQTLEMYKNKELAKEIDASIDFEVRNLLSVLEPFSKILEQDSVKTVFSNVSEKSLTDYPFLTNFYSESSVQSRAVGNVVGYLGGICYYSAGTVYTVNGNSVDVYEAERELTDDQILNSIDRYASYGNTFVSSPTSYYNCHSYAWYDYSHTNPYWINFINSYTEDAACTRLAITEAQVNDIIVYYDAAGDVAHSGVVYTPDSTGHLIIRSKWGQDAVYDHYITNVPDTYTINNTDIRVSAFRYHDYSNVYLGSNYHSGNQHYYLYGDICGICGDQTNVEWVTIPCLGNCIEPW